MSTLDEVADELYGVPPGDFVAARTEQVLAAKKAKDAELAKQVGALRKPSTAAWVVNLLVRQSRDEVEQLLQLGEALREAQSSLSGAELRDLNRARHQVLTALGHRGRSLAAEAGQRISAAVEEDVQATLSAALADPDAAEQVRAGRLTSSLSYEGFGPALSEEATPSPAPQREKHSERRRRDAEREERARQEAERRERQRRERERRAKLEKQRREAAAAVRDAEAEAAEAHRRADTADRALEKARAALEKAERAIESASD